MSKPKSLKELMTLIKDNKKILDERFGVIDIAFFGSYIKKKQNRKSDIDIFVELKSEFKTFDIYMELKFFLEDIFQKKVDIVLKDSIRKELKPKILKEAIHVR